MANYEFDMIIRNGLLIEADADERKADIGVKDGKIKAIAPAGTLESARVIKEAEGKYVMPGLIDPHMHVKAPFGGTIDILDFYSASKVAAYGGVTTFMDFSNTQKGDSVLDAVDARKEEMAESALDYSVHAKFVESSDAILDEIKTLVKEGIPTFKMFTTYDGVKIPDDDILKIMERAKECGAMCGFHAESDPISVYNKAKLTKEGKLDWKYFPVWKPNECEAEAVYRIISYAKVVDVPVYFYHLSAHESVELVRKAKAEGIKVLAETCTHYLVFSKEKNDGPDGILFLMSPPLREREDCDAMWQALKDGTLDLVSSDNEAFHRHQKEANLLRDDNNNPIPDFSKPVNGLPGLEERFGVLMNAVNQGAISLKEFVAYSSTNPAKVFGCYPTKGCLKVGSDADIVIVDPKKEMQLTKDNLHYGLDYSLYEDMQCEGWPVVTIRRGEVLVENGKFLGKKGSGKFLERKLDSAN